jgi:hypothetical protein
MSNPFQVLPWDVVRDIFSEEVEYLRAGRWEFAQHKPDLFMALGSNCFSLHHLDQIRRQMDVEAAETARKIAEAERANRNPAALVGSHRGY